MNGAMIGDIVGSIYEFNNHRSKAFDFYSNLGFYTDDTVMTLAIGKALIDCKGDYRFLSEKVVHHMRRIGRRYPYAGYGGMFNEWLYKLDPQPYGSYGNGAGMRVSACGIVGNTLDEVIYLSNEVTKVTHNHPEGIKAAEAIAVLVFMARQKKTKLDMQTYVREHYYPIDFTLDDIRDTYRFEPSAQKTTPQAIVAFLESTSFEDAIRNAISVGGDSDTMAAMTGAIAEAYYGIPKTLKIQGEAYLDKYLSILLKEFENEYPPKVIDDVSSLDVPLYAHL